MESHKGVLGVGARGGICERAMERCSNKSQNLLQAYFMPSGTHPAVWWCWFMGMGYKRLTEPRNLPARPHEYLCGWAPKQPALPRL